MKKILRFMVAALVAVVALTVSKSFAQESDDAMTDFMNDAGSTDALPAPTADAPAAPAAKNVVKPEAKSGAKSAPLAATPEAAAADADFVDMRGDQAAPPAVPVVQANPALDKLEALMIADAEMKAFMKAGGLRSRKIK